MLLVQSQYKAGVRHGASKLFFANGRALATGKYKDGHIAGGWEFLRPDGERYESLCGDYEYAEEFWPSGALRARGLRMDGVLQGKWQYFWPDGTPLLTAWFWEGKAKGKWLHRHFDGMQDEAFFGAVWGEREIDDIVMRIPWAFLLEDLLAKDNTPLHLEALRGNRQAPDFEEPQTPLPELANALFAEWEVTGAVGVQDFALSLRPDFRVADLPHVLLQLVQADTSLTPGMVENALRAMGQSVFRGQLTLDMRPSAKGLDLAVRRCISTWALTLGESAWWDGVLAIDSACNGRFNSSMRPLPREALVPGGVPVAEALSLRMGANAKIFPDREWPKLLDGGVQWLADEQLESGGWEAKEPRFEVGVSGLALMALLGSGNSLTQGRHTSAVARAAAWLCRHQDQETGLFASPHQTVVNRYDHLIATLAIAELCVLSPSAELESVLELATRASLILKGPHAGWGDVPFTKGIWNIGKENPSATAWGLQGLVAYRIASRLEGAPLDSNTGSLALGVLWFERWRDEGNGLVSYSENYPGSYREFTVNSRYESSQLPLSAAGVYCTALAGGVYKKGAWKPTLDLLLKDLPDISEGENYIDMYEWYFCAQAAYMVGGKHWKKWSKAFSQVASELVREEGSWAANGAWGMYGGEVYSTAMMCLCLEAPIRYRRPD